MTRVSVISLFSGSDGNCTAVVCGNDTLLIDAGRSARAIGSALDAAGIAADSIRAVFITHEHSDHMKGCRVFSNKYGIKTYMTSLTCSGGLRANLLPERKTLFSTGCAFELCGMRIEAFTVPHDVDTVGFVFRVGDRKLGVATDLGHLNMLARQKLHDCAVLVLESNHDKTLLMNSPRPIQLKRRIIGRHGHLSNDDALDSLSELLTEHTHDLILAHLSGECNNMQLLQKLAPALNVEVTDLLMDFSTPDKPGRVQLESMLVNGELEIWYRSKKLSEKELRRVYRVIEAALDDWDEKDAAGE